MVPARLLAIIIPLSAPSLLPAQAPPPELIDTAWHISPNTYRHTVKHLQIYTKPAPRNAISPAGMFKCNRLKSLQLPVTDFKAGDTLDIVVSNPDNHPFESITVHNTDKKQLAGTVNTANATLRLVVPNAKQLSLQIKSRLSLKKQVAQISILCVKPVKPDSFYSVQDTIFSLNQSVIRDTLLLPVLDDTLTLPPSRNIESLPTPVKMCVIPVSVEKNARLSHVSYWIGIGRDCLARFSNLEATIPPHWSRPGVSPALGAYSMGQFISLPTTYRHDVTWTFTQKNNQKTPTPLFPECQGAQSCTLQFNKSKPFRLGNSTISVANEQLQLVVRLKNNNTVVGYPVRIIMTGCFIRETPGKITRTILQVRSFKEGLRQ